MNRLDKIKQEFLKQFQDKLDEEGVDLSIESAFDILVSADPSRNKKNVRWLIETYLNDGFLWEDIQSGEYSKVHETLNVFIRNKNKLDIVDRSINRYQSIADMWKIVKEYAEDKTGKEVKRDEHDKAMDESEVVIDNDDIRIIVPLTKYAAKFHGRGTRWCTAADSNNMFWSYAPKAPLFIITLKGSGDKLQLWKNGDDIQFMDYDDKTVSKEYVEQNWNLLKDIIKYIGKLKFVSHNVLTQELCEIAVKQDSDTFKNIPDRFKTLELCKIAVEKNIRALKDVPEHLITPELCKIAVQQNVRALHYVPDKYKTPELCELACKQNGVALFFVPDNLITPELCKIAIEQNVRALQEVPEELRTPELCKIACEQDGFALSYVPDEYMTRELCKLACEQNGRALQKVPEELRTPELCKIACEQDGTALEFVPNMTSEGVSLRTPELCELACEQNGKALKHVPGKYITPELSELALKQYCDSRSDDYYSRVFESVFKYIPEKYRTSELYQIAIKQDKDMFEHIPEDVFTPELCEEAIKKDIGFIQDIPRKFVTPELAKFGMEHHPIYAVLYLMPSDLLTYEICEYAVKQGYSDKQDMGHSTCLSREEWDSIDILSNKMKAIQKEEDRIRIKENNTVSKDGIKSIQDKYQSKIDEFKKCFNMLSIEPSQTISHTM